MTAQLSPTLIIPKRLPRHKFLALSPKERYRLIKALKDSKSLAPLNALKPTETKRERQAMRARFNSLSYEGLTSERPRTSSETPL